MVGLIPLFFISPVSFGQTENEEDEWSYKERRKFEQLLHDAGKAKILEDYEQAIELFEASRKINPDVAAPHYELGALYLHFGEFERAIENGQKAAEMDPQNFYFRLSYAEILKSAQNLDLALQEYERLIKDFPNQLPIYMDLALIHLLKKDFKKAINAYDELEKKIGVTEEISLKKQYLYLQAGEVGKATEEIEKLIEYFPNKPEYYLLLAEVYSVNELNDKALKVYKNAIVEFPQNPDIFLSFSEFYREQDDINKAFEYVEKAFRNPNLDVDRKVQTLLAYFDIMNEKPGYSNKIENLGDILLEVHPDNARVLTINGDICLNLNKSEKARRHFIKAVELDEGRYPIWNQLLILDAELEKFDTLEIHANQAILLFPNQPLIYYFMGFAQAQQSKYESAIKSYEDGLKIVVGNNLLKTQMYLGLADACHEMENHQCSDEAFESVLSLDSNNTVALNNYSYYLSVRGEHLPRAKRLSARSNSLEPNQSTYQDTYAWILYKMEDYKGAREWMEKAINNGGDKSGVILEHMGDILYKLNFPDQAIKYWQKAKDSGDASELIEKKIREGQLYE